MVAGESPKRTVENFNSRMFRHQVELFTSRTKLQWNTESVFTTTTSSPSPSPSPPLHIRPSLPPTTPLPSPYSALAPRPCFAATALRKGRDRSAAPLPPTPRPRTVLTKVPLSPCSPTPSSKDRGHPCVKGAIGITPHCLHSGRPVGQAAVRAGAAAAPALETHINTFSRGVVGDGVRRLAPVGSIGGRRGFHRNRRRWRCRRRRRR